VKSKNGNFTIKRFSILRDLVAFSKPIHELSGILSQLDWDYEGEPLIVTASEVKSVLKRFLAGECSAQDIEAWANLLELREDLQFEEHKLEAIENVIHCLANPVLQGEITPDLCESLLGSLD